MVNNLDAELEGAHQSPTEAYVHFGPLADNQQTGEYIWLAKYPELGRDFYYRSLNKGSDVEDIIRILLQRKDKPICNNLFVSTGGFNNEKDKAKLYKLATEIWKDLNIGGKMTRKRWEDHIKKEENKFLRELP